MNRQGLMRHLPTVLAILSLPAGVLGYALGAQLMAVLDPPEPIGGILGLFVPLLIAGLVMLPLLAPAFDRMAKRDLARRPNAPRDDRPSDRRRPRDRSR